MNYDRRSARLREELLARKRNQEYHKQLLWNDVNRYYKTSELRSLKYNIWTSPQFYEERSRNKSCEQKQKESQKRLQERRQKLSNLLSEEQRSYDAEIKEKNTIFPRNISRKMPHRVIPSEDVQCLNAEMKRTEEERRAKAIELARYNQWKSSQPILREHEKRLQQEAVKDTWTEQIKEKQMMEEREKELTLQLEREMQRKKMLEEEEEKLLLQKKQEEARKLQSELMEQMQEIKFRDQQAQELRKWEEQQLRMKLDLEQLAIRRNEMEKQRRNKEFSAILRHQFQAKLKQKTKQVQEELEEDRRLLDEICRCLEQEELQTNIRREQTRKEIDRANAFLKQYVNLEKEREKQLEFIFHEEARRMWRKQEQEWKVEQEYRNNLMRDVLTSLQQQVKDKLQINAEQQKQLLEAKESMLKGMEEANEALKQRQKEIKDMQENFANDLHQQMAEKEIIKERMRTEMADEHAKQQAKIAEEEQKILAELRKMELSSPPVSLR